MKNFKEVVKNHGIKVGGLINDGTRICDPFLEESGSVIVDLDYHGVTFEEFVWDMGDGRLVQAFSSEEEMKDCFEKYCDLNQVYDEDFDGVVVYYLEGGVESIGEGRCFLDEDVDCLVIVGCEKDEEDVIKLSGEMVEIPMEESVREVDEFEGREVMTLEEYYGWDEDEIDEWNQGVLNNSIEEEERGGFLGGLMEAFGEISYNGSGERVYEIGDKIRVCYIDGEKGNGWRDMLDVEDEKVLKDGLVERVEEDELWDFCEIHNVEGKWKIVDDELRSWLKDQIENKMEEIIEIREDDFVDQMSKDVVKFDDYLSDDGDQRNVFDLMDDMKRRSDEIINGLNEGLEKVLIEKEVKDLEDGIRNGRDYEVGTVISVIWVENKDGERLLKDLVDYESGEEIYREGMMVRVEWSVDDRFKFSIEGVKGEWSFVDMDDEREWSDRLNQLEEESDKGVDDLNHVDDNEGGIVRMPRTWNEVVNHVFVDQAFSDSDGYWVYLKDDYRDEWFDSLEIVRCIHEMRVSDIIQRFNGVVKIEEYQVNDEDPGEDPGEVEIENEDDDKFWMRNRLKNELEWNGDVDYFDVEIGEGDSVEYRVFIHPVGSMMNGVVMKRVGKIWELSGMTHRLFNEKKIEEWKDERLWEKRMEIRLIQSWENVCEIFDDFFRSVNDK
jgi:hypothetical protein